MAMKRISLEFLLIFPSAFSKRKKNHPLLLAVFLLRHTLTNSRFQFRPTHIYSLFFWHNTTDLDWLNLQHQLKYFFSSCRSSRPSPPHPPPPRPPPSTLEIARHLVFSPNGRRRGASRFTALDA